MQKTSVDAIIIPTTDPHQSEYIADYWKCREWLTGFNGSAGVAIVTQQIAHLWTDSRYFIQADEQLIAPFELKKQTTKQPEYINWLNENLNNNSTIGYNGQLFSVNQIEMFTNTISEKSILLTDIGDIFSDIWIDRPKLIFNDIIEHLPQYTGTTRLEKIQKLKSQLHEQNANSTLLSKLDDIAWILNIRGSDIEFNPLVLSYFLIEDNALSLFINPEKVTPDLLSSLQNDGIKLFKYTQIGQKLSELNNESIILIEKDSINTTLFNYISGACSIIDKTSYVTQLKAIKNKHEIECYKQTQIRDSIALCKFFFWLEKTFKTERITELSAAEKLESFRKQQEHFMGVSFTSISAFGAHAALPHYSATKDSDCTIDDSNLYLLDSGGQYLDGTTDITRTICLGTPTEEQKNDFTLVLKGHINLATAKFPAGTKGYQLDPLARHALWQNGKDYGHGTGHGIGYFLNVHEGPQGFSTEANGPAGTALSPGMLITNEPGYYLEGEYGIRTENILLCAPSNDKNRSNFLEFETVNFFPIDINLIDEKSLTKNEKIWLNNYHKQTFDKLSPFLDEQEIKWLKEKTKSI